MIPAVERAMDRIFISMPTMNRTRCSGGNPVPETQKWCVWLDPCGRRTRVCRCHCMARACAWPVGSGDAMAAARRSRQLNMLPRSATPDADPAYIERAKDKKGSVPPDGLWPPGLQETTTRGRCGGMQKTRE